MGKVSLDPWAYWFGALLILLLPLNWLLAAATAAVFHELCHAGAIYALGGRVYSLRIGITGAVMETELDGRGREALAALAGPGGSFLLVLLGRWIPRVAVCAAIQGLFNLLPLYPLDGGRALRRGLEGFLPEGKIRLVEGVLALLVILLTIRYTAVFLLIWGIRQVYAKIPCKQRKIGVQ